MSVWMPGLGLSIKYIPFGHSICSIFETATFENFFRASERSHTTDKGRVKPFVLNTLYSLLLTKPGFSSTSEDYFVMQHPKNSLYLLLSSSIFASQLLHG